MRRSRRSWSLSDAQSAASISRTVSPRGALARLRTERHGQSAILLAAGLLARSMESISPKWRALTLDISVSNPPKRALGPQRFANGEIHDWYRLVLGFSDHLVAGLIAEFELSFGDNVLDPFCGTGTTLIECMKRGINAWGLDANPSSCFAAGVKTTWSLQQSKLASILPYITTRFRKIRDLPNLSSDAFYSYCSTSGMLERRWLTKSAALDATALKRAIDRSKWPKKYKNICLLAAMNELVHRVSNVKFGPELYCSPTKTTAKMLDSFKRHMSKVPVDLANTRGLVRGKIKVFDFDSRSITLDLIDGPSNGFDAIICSPPYPTEHDYTRNSRLELAFLEHVIDSESLRAIKKRMIRSHTKGIYQEDKDRDSVAGNSEINEVANEIAKRAKKKKYGFARLYSTVLKEYFGGMYRHFQSAFGVLRPGGHCAYVVGDQASYFQVPVKTAQHLANVATAVGFEVLEIRKWRHRASTTSRGLLDENILILKKPVN